MTTKPEPVAWRYVPGDVWGCAILTHDSTTANLAREFGREVEELFTAAQLAAAVAAERERCARIAENTATCLLPTGSFLSERVAAAIRQEPAR